MAVNSDASNSLKEIDLRGFFRTLYASKALIALVIVLVTGATALYAFLTPPIYQTAVQILPPSPSGLASYNLASQLTGVAISGTVDGVASPGIEPLTSTEAYKVFLRYLNSNTIRQLFFDQYYLPAQAKNATEGDKERAWKRLTRQLNVELPNLRDNDYEARLTLEGHNPKVIAKWADSYVELAIQSAREDLLSGLASQLKIREQSLENQISTLREIATTTKRNRIIRLEEALTIAESIGLVDPPLGAPVVTIGNRTESETLMNGNALYMRGSKALRSELEQLKHRESDDAYITELPNLLKKLALIRDVDLNPTLLSVAMIDREAIEPQEPFKPQKALLIALGLILGAVLGIFIALVFRLVRDSK
ncbi:Wzz/FepE/Etk N-terminal domain-containing protein [Pusillimonas noertemannii]|uniref:Chain length determinant protein (Polysaccharide antigen chain regulator) n=1 Tax=Pusillimonas noertemannii TaxID=305977 RepID=A0A2U1CPQ3_9BURK|nr:Wzz/FepE/Etk N-terminal domain-containing protein [Pusillimonas noertemannii]NYT67188.1 LPS O-antigen chain length determinant protein WzzB [Pusillimonas noertemannii]PVY67865.1 chain length determinant protein (polysaccharide antigen chain regulator) [Pusillimonas noertemannii]TFL12612.1 hypothetical protein CSC72_05815 [Pusillimonas noertemannii]